MLIDVTQDSDTVENTTYVGEHLDNVLSRSQQQKENEFTKVGQIGFHGDLIKVVAENYRKILFR